MKFKKKKIVTNISAIIVMLSVGIATAATVTTRMLGRPYTKINNNLHQIDGPPPSQGTERHYRLYRSATPSRHTFEKWCSEYKIERVIVMDGTAQLYELSYQREGICENIQVIYNINQGLTPVSEGFLQWFDDQVDAARRDKAGLLFRCKTGSHRTGRLAAYYQMKYQDLTLDQALDVMDHKGKWMWFWNIIMAPQVRAMHDFLEQKPCSQPLACVVRGAHFWVE